MPKLTLTITAEVDADEFQAFLEEHGNVMADVADSFDARLNEVFGPITELTTVRVQSVQTTEQEG
jgi:CRP-like cAMP-binding protein